MRGPPTPRSHDRRGWVALQRGRHRVSGGERTTLLLCCPGKWGGGAETSVWQGKKATLHASGGIALLSAKCCDVAEPAAVEDTLFFHPGCCIVFIRWSHLGAIHSAPPRCRAMLGICANLPFYEVQSSTKKT